MGNSPSKTPEPVQDKAFYAERPVRFGQNLVNHLANNPEPTSSRQQTIDDHIRNKISSEVARLREEEDSIRQQVERALEKENLDREQALQAEGKEKSSVTLMRDLQEVRRKVERQREKRDLKHSWPQVAEKRKAVEQCYRNNPTRSLDCQVEVEDFRLAVKEMEKEFLAAQAAR